jgi:hypothetical protein
MESRRVWCGACWHGAHRRWGSFREVEWRKWISREQKRWRRRPALVERWACQLVGCWSRFAMVGTWDAPARLASSVRGSGRERRAGPLPPLSGRAELARKKPSAALRRARCSLSCARRRVCRICLMPGRRWTGRRRGRCVLGGEGFEVRRFSFVLCRGCSWRCCFSSMSLISLWCSKRCGARSVFEGEDPMFNESVPFEELGGESVRGVVRRPCRLPRRRLRRSAPMPL